MKLRLDDAFGELIDNAVDNFEKQQLLGFSGRQLNIRITIDEASDQIIVVENSWVVHPEDLFGFVQLVGESPVRNAIDVASIGVWGSGGKQALGRLGFA